MHLHVHFFHWFPCFSLFACLFPHKDSVILLLLLLLCLGGCCFHYCCVLLHAAHRVKLTALGTSFCAQMSKKPDLLHAISSKGYLSNFFDTIIYLSLAVIFCWPGFYDVVDHFFGANSLQLLRNSKEYLCLCVMFVLVFYERWFETWNNSSCKSSYFTISFKFQNPL